MQSLVHLKLMPFDDLNTTLPKAPPLLSRLFKNATATDGRELALLSCLRVGRRFKASSLQTGACKHGSLATFDTLFLLQLYALIIALRELMLLITFRPRLNAISALAKGINDIKTISSSLSQKHMSGLLNMVKGADGNCHQTQATIDIMPVCRDRDWQ
jgi:hypothetical protein